MIGNTISHFRITGKLGEGGMGVIYLAEDTTLGRRVALKFLPPATASDENARARFLNEARAAAALSHPNICTVYEVGESGGDVFIAMALVEGVTLNETMAGAPLPLDQAVRLAMQIAEALSAAHEKGVVHRDVKPGNIMVTPKGDAVVTDFGLAKISGAARLTRTGSTTGTPAYMSPEQARGDRVDYRSDIWSLGAVLYEMITGRRPFRGDGPQATLYSILNDAPKPPTALRSNVPMELERIILKAMARRPDDRYQHMDDLLVDLRAVQRLLSGPEGPSDSVATVKSHAPTFHRRRVPAALTVTVVAVAVIAAVFFWIRRGEEAHPGTERVLVLPFENHTGQPSMEAIGELVAAGVSEGMARTGLVDVMGVPPRARRRLEGLPELARANDADMVVWGSYLAHGDSLTFQTHLQSFGRQPTDIVFSVTGPSEPSSSGIAVVRERAMGAVAAAQDPVASLSVNRHAPLYSAYQEYASGMKLFGADTRAALGHFRSANDIDSEFTPAWTARLYALGALGRYAAADSLVAELRAAGSPLSPRDRRAVDLMDARLKGNLAEALRLGRQALKDPPYDYGVQRMMIVLTTDMNRPKETLEIGRRLLEQEPDIYLKSWTYGAMINAYHLLSAHARELELARKAIAEFPDLLWLRTRESQALAAQGRVDEIERIITEASAIPTQGVGVVAVMQITGRELIAHGWEQAGRDLLQRAAARLESSLTDQLSDSQRFTLAQFLYDAERYEDAMELFKQLSQNDRDDLNALGYLGVTAARLGDYREARRIRDELVAWDEPYDFGNNLYWAACVSAQLGELDDAMDFLRRAQAEGSGMDIHIHRDNDLQPLWGYEPFREFLRPKG